MPVIMNVKHDPEHRNTNTIVSNLISKMCDGMNVQDYVSILLTCLIWLFASVKESDPEFDIDRTIDEIAESLKRGIRMEVEMKQETRQ